MQRSTALILLVTAALSLVTSCGSERSPTAVGDVTVHSFRIDSTNVGVIVGDERTLLVDIGLEGALSQLKERFEAEGLDYERVSDLVLTHGHGDHAGDANAVQADDVTVWAHEKEIPTLHSQTDLEEGQIIGCEAQVLSVLISDSWDPVDPDRLMDGPTNFDDLNVRVIPASGHTPGSVIVVVDDKIAFLGDLIRGGNLGGAVFGDQPNVHYFHLDKDAAHRSLRGLLRDFPDIEVFWPAHGDAFTRAQLQAFVDEQPKR